MEAGRPGELAEVAASTEQEGETKIFMPMKNEEKKMFGLDLSTKESEEQLAAYIDKKLDEMPETEVEKTALLQTVKGAVTRLEPKHREAALALLLQEFENEALSGKHFYAYGLEVCIQQVPTYSFCGDVENARLEASVKRLEMQLSARNKKLKGHRESLVAEGKAKLEHMDYRLQVFRKKK